jgi:predicted ArsR family transcriptional regulator
MDSLDTLSLPQRVVMLGLTTLERDGETPAQVHVVTRTVKTHVEAIDDIGKLTEAEVDSALHALEADGVVESPSTDDTSPVGKGRPAYEPAVDVDALLDTLAADERLASAVDQIEAI